MGCSESVLQSCTSRASTDFAIEALSAFGTAETREKLQPIIEEYRDSHPDRSARDLYVICGKEDKLSQLEEIATRLGIEKEEYHLALSLLNAIQYAEITRRSSDGKIVVPDFSQYEPGDWEVAVEHFLSKPELQECLSWNTATVVPERYVVFQVLLSHWFNRVNPGQGPLKICDIGSSFPPLALSLINTEGMKKLFTGNVNCPQWYYEKIASSLEKHAIDIQQITPEINALYWQLACLWPEIGKPYRKQLIEAYLRTDRDPVKFHKGDVLERLEEFDNHSLDAITSSMMFYQMNSEVVDEELFPLVERKLKPGGVLIVTEKEKLTGKGFYTTALHNLTKAEERLQLLPREVVISTDENARGDILYASPSLFPYLESPAKLDPQSISENDLWKILA